MRPHEPGGHESRFYRIEPAGSAKRVIAITGEVMTLEDPGQPVGAIGTQRTTRTARVR